MNKKSIHQLLYFRKDHFIKKTHYIVYKLHNIFFICHRENYSIFTTGDNSEE